MAEPEAALNVWLPEKLKLRLDLFALKNKMTLKEATVRILNEGLPNYEIK